MEKLRKIINRNAYSKRLALAMILSITLFFAILPIASAELTQWDNTKTYDSAKEEIVISNTFLKMFTTTDIAKMNLITPREVKIFAGKDRKVAEIDIELYGDYNSFIDNVRLVDMKTGKEVTREISYKYKTIEGIEVPNYVEVCDDVYDVKNGTTQKSCYLKEEGTRIEQKERWLPLEKLDFQKGITTIGLFTEVFNGDNVDWQIKTGGLWTEEWATWTADFNTNLRSYYKLNETSGNRIDSLGLYNITISGGTLYNSTGLIAGSWMGDQPAGANSGNYGTMGAVLSSITSFSLSIWYYSWASGGTNSRIIEGGSSSEFIQLAPIGCGNEQNKLCFSVNGQSSTLNININNNIWYNLIITSASNGRSFLYLDGSLVGNISAGTYTGETESIRFGGHTAGNTYNLLNTMKVDELGIWANRVLSPTEVVSLYNSGAGLTYTGDFPATVTAIKSFPANNTNSTNRTIGIGCNFTSENQNISTVAVNVTDSTGVQAYANTIDNVDAISYNATWNALVTYDDNFNFSCIGYGSSAVNGSAFGSNYLIDSTLPIITIAYPQETNYSINVSALNFTAVDIHGGQCVYSRDNGVTNSTAVNYGTNFTGVTSIEDYNTWTLFCNDTFGNRNKTAITFFKDTIYPQIEYDVTNPVDGAIIPDDNWTITVVPADANLRNMTFRYYDNVTAYSTVVISLKTISLPDGTYTYNATACDVVNNCNTTETRSITIDTLHPIFTIEYPLSQNYSSNVSELNYSINHPTGTMQACWYSLDEGQTNVSITCLTNATGLNSIEGFNTWTIYGNDTAGNEGSTSVTFFKDTIFPTINMIAPADNFETVNELDVFFNATALDINLVNITIYLSNTTSSLAETSSPTSEKSFTYSFPRYGQQFWYVTACDILNNCNNSATRTIYLSNLQTSLVSPADGNVSYVYPINLICSANLSTALNGYITNISLWTNQSGVMSRNQTITATSTNISDYDDLTGTGSINAAKWLLSSSGQIAAGYDSNALSISATVNTTSGSNPASSSITVTTKTFTDRANNITMDVGLATGTSSNGAVTQESSFTVFGTKIYSLNSPTGEFQPALSDRAIWNFIRKANDISKFDVYRNGVYNQTITATNYNITLHAEFGGFITRTAETSLYNLTYDTPTSSQYSFQYNLNSPNLWTCQACSSDGTCAFANENRTISRDATPPAITIFGPTGNIASFGTNLTLNYSITDVNVDSCWFEYAGVNTTIPCGGTDYSFLINNSFGNTLRVYANDTIGNINSSVTTWAYSIQIIGVTYNPISYETAHETYTITFNTMTTAITASATFIYGGISYPSIAACSNLTCVMTNSLDIPLLVGGIPINNSFQWNIQEFDGTSTILINSSSYKQEINPISLGACGGAINIPTLNFSAYDEQNRTRIYNWIFDAEFTYYTGLGTTKKVFNETINATDEVLICLNQNTTFFIDSIIAYSKDASYLTRNYFTQYHPISNVTQVIPLYLLKTAASTSFILKVQNQDVLPVPGVLVVSQRYYPGSNSYETVQIDRTGQNGLTSGNFEAEGPLYQFFITNQSQTLLSVIPGSRVVPGTSPYTLLFQIGSGYQSPIFGMDNTTGVTAIFGYNKTAGQLVMAYSDTSGNFTVSQVTILQSNFTGTSNPVICNNFVNSSTGINACNITVAGTYIGNAYIYRNNTIILVGQTNFVVETFSSIIGGFGIFLAFFLILISAFAFKYNEIAGIWAVIVTMFAVNFIQLVNFGWVFMTSITLIGIVITAMLDR